MADDTDTILAVGVTGAIAAGAAYMLSRDGEADTEQESAAQQQSNTGLSAAVLAALMSRSDSAEAGSTPEQPTPDSWGAGNPTEEWHTLTISGDSETADQYSISVTGQAEMDAWAESPDDSAGNGTISGIIDRGYDSYRFTGEVTDMQLPSHAQVSVDGTVIRARDAGSGTRPGSSVPNNLMDPPEPEQPAPDEEASGGSTDYEYPDHNDSNDYDTGDAMDDIGDGEFTSDEEADFWTGNL